MEGLSRDRRLILTCETFNRGQFATKKACAAAFNIKISTLKDHLNRIKPRAEIEANLRKLSNNNELVLKRRSLELDSQGYPLTIAKVRCLAEILLSSKLK